MQTFAGKVTFLLFNMLPRFVSFSSKEQVSFNCMAVVTICSDFGAQENKVYQFPLFPHLFVMKWWNQIPWSLFFECWVLSQLFHSLLLPLSSSSLVPFHFSATKIVSSAYLRLLIFLPAVFIPACASSSPAFHMMHSAYMLRNGNPLQYSCLKNSMDRGAWWAEVLGFAKSWTQLKQLSTAQLIYKVVLVLSGQQSGSDIHICV